MNAGPRRTPASRFVPQEPALDAASTVYDAVALGLGDEGQVLADYHHATARLADDGHDPRALAAVDALHARLDAIGGWALGNRIDAVLSRLELPADAVIGTLSGGWKKRVALAQALAAEPDRAVAGRADQPSRPRRHRLARRAAAEFHRRRGLRHP